MNRYVLPSDHFKLHIFRGRKILNLRVYVSVLFTFLLLVNMKHILGAAEKDCFEVIDVSAYIYPALTMTNIRFVGGIVSDN
jgi:hypothetical protein